MEKSIYSISPSFQNKKSLFFFFHILRLVYKGSYSLSYSFLGSLVTSTTVQTWQPMFIKLMKRWVYGMVSQDFLQYRSLLPEYLLLNLQTENVPYNVLSYYLLRPSNIASPHRYCIHSPCYTARTIYLTLSLQFWWRLLVIVIRYMKPGTMLALVHGSQVFQNLTQSSST